MDLDACELESPGPFLAFPVIQDGDHVAHFRLLRSQGKADFSSSDLQALERMAPLLAVAASQEFAWLDLARGMAGVAGAASEEAVLEELASQVRSLLRSDEDGVAVFLMDFGESSEAEPSYLFRAPAHLELARPVYRPSEPGLTAHVITTRQSLFSIDLPRDTAPGGALEGTRHEAKQGETGPASTRSFIAVPLLSPYDEHVVMGVVRVASTRLGAFSLWDLDALEMAARQTSEVLGRVWRSEQVLQALVDSSEVPIVELDGAGRVRTANRAAEQLLGQHPLADEDIVQVAYRGERRLAGATNSEIRCAGGLLTGHHLLCFKQCRLTRRHIPIPVRLSASPVWEKGRGRGDERRAGSIGRLKDLRTGCYDDHITVFGGDEYSAITVDSELANQLRDLQRPGLRRSDRAIFIEGETGTGKEVVAATIQRWIGCDEPIRTLNCAGLSESLLEAELFGYVQGAFTDARKSRFGLFDPKYKGVVFLDEIGELTATSQAKLLRVLDRQKIRRVGEHVERSVDVQLVVAAQRPLEELGFRHDLVYRLRGKHFRIPALRQRRADIMLLAEAFREEELKQAKLPLDWHPIGFSSEVIEALLTYSWPGNVRELQHEVQLAVERYWARTSEPAEQQFLTLQDFDSLLREVVPSARPASAEEGRNATAIAMEIARLKSRVTSLEAQLRTASRPLPGKLRTVREKVLYVVSNDASVKNHLERLRRQRAEAGETERITAQELQQALREYDIEAGRTSWSDVARELNEEAWEDQAFRTPSSLP